jgi:hypothetical protein
VKHQETTTTAEPVTRAPNLELVPLIWTSNGEAGDGQEECSGCTEERDEPHTVSECAETKRRLDAAAEEMVRDFLKTEEHP